MSETRIEQSQTLQEAIFQSGRLEVDAKLASQAQEVAEGLRDQLEAQATILTEQYAEMVGRRFDVGAKCVYELNTDTHKYQEKTASDFDTLISVDGYFSGFEVFDRTERMSMSWTHNYLRSSRLVVCMQFDWEKREFYIPPLYVPLNAVEGRIKEV